MEDFLCLLNETVKVVGTVNLLFIKMIFMLAMAFLMNHPFLLQECNIEEVSDEEDPPSKSSKDKKANGPDSGKATSLVFKITSKVAYKTVLKGIIFSLHIFIILAWNFSYFICDVLCYNCLTGYPFILQHTVPLF